MSNRTYSEEYLNTVRLEQISLIQEFIKRHKILLFKEFCKLSKESFESSTLKKYLYTNNYDQLCNHELDIISEAIRIFYVHMDDVDPDVPLFNQGTDIINRDYPEFKDWMALPLLELFTVTEVNLILHFRIYKELLKYEHSIGEHDFEHYKKHAILANKNGFEIYGELSYCPETKPHFEYKLEEMWELNDGVRDHAAAIYNQLSKLKTVAKALKRAGIKLVAVKGFISDAETMKLFKNEFNCNAVLTKIDKSRLRETVKLDMEQDDMDSMPNFF